MRGNASLETLAAHLAALALQCAQTPPHAGGYTAPELERALGLGMRALAQPLTLCGWQRCVIFTRRFGKPRCRVLWFPPGQSVPTPRRGRPPFAFTNLLGVFCHV